MAASASRVLGRSRELESCEQVISGDPPWVIVIEGAAGIGKTTVWDVAVDRARGAGARVLVSRPREHERGLSHRVLVELLDQLEDDAFRPLPRPHARALLTLLGREDGGIEDRVALIVAVRRVLSILSADAPLVVAVDDAQWVDRTSAEVLSSAILSASPLSVGMLLSCRVGEPNPLLASREQDPVISLRINVEALSFGAVAQLVQERFGGGWSRMLLHTLWELSAGNPLVALEMARAAQTDRTAIAISPRLGDWEPILRERLDGLAPEPLLAVRAGAVLTRPTRADVLGLAADVGGIADIDAAIDADWLVERDQAGQLDFVHPLLRAAAEQHMPSRLRRLLHRSAAARSAAPEDRARHLSNAADGADPSLAAALEEAAESLTARDSPWLAVDFAERALELTVAGDAGTRQRRVLLVVDALVAAGDLARARVHLVKALNGSTGRYRAEILWRTYQTDDDNDRDLDVTLSVLSAALAAIGFRIGQPPAVSLEDSALARKLLGDYVNEVGPQAGRLAEARAIAAQAARLPVDLTGGVDARIPMDVQVMLWVDPVAAYETLVALPPNPPGIEIGFYWRRDASIGLQAMWHGQIPIAGPMLDAVAADITATGHVAESSMAKFHLAELRWRQGRWTEADALLDEAADGLQWGTGGEVAGWYLRALLAGCRGEVAAAMADADRGRAASRAYGTRLWAMQSDWAAGHAALVVGDPRAAGILLGCEDWMPELVEIGFSRYLPDSVEALVNAGRLEEAAVRRDRLRATVQTVPTQLWARAVERRCTGLILSAQARHEDAADALVDAVRLSRETTEPYEIARALLVHGGVLRRLRRRREAAIALKEAVGLFAALGAPTWQAKAQSELERSGGRTGGKALTPTEARVAQLAADGLSNADIARQLVVSVKTVEANLTRVYAKVGARSRASLVRLLSQQPDLAP